MVFKKKKIVINDLPSNEAGFNCGLTTNWGVLMSQAFYFGDYSPEEDEEATHDMGASVNTIEYLEGLDGIQKKEVAIKAAAILEREKSLVETLGAEVVDLYAQQKVDLEEAPSAYGSKEPNTKVSIVLQRMGKAGDWYTPTDKEKVPLLSISADIDDLFTINEKDYSSKRVGSLSLMEHLVEKYKVTMDHAYSYVDTNGRYHYVRQEQRILLSSGCFKAGCIIDGNRLEASVSPFWWGLDKEKNVVTKPTFYSDMATEVDDYLFVLPSGDDESHGDAGNASFDEGIMYGQTVATQAMMSDYMADQAVANNASEHYRTEFEAVRVRRTQVATKEIKNLYDLELLKTEIGLMVTTLIPLSHKIKESRKAEVEFSILLSEYQDRAEEILLALDAHKRVHKVGLEYSAWKMLNTMAIRQKNKKFADMVDSHILENIASLNDGSLLASKLNDEEVIEIREASLKFGKKTKACWIANAHVSNEIKRKYAHIKGVKV